ncbi:UDP-N-acetylmuramoyl-L-alanyl-D-glutamate--2,6-diaminopimelate ligase [Nocardioidaceae bacterium]|nr:UDP-N-acetylmuramoyl-L-alanyl-D-glutamate--2,6-diaminopimelate ligase [Nocardioidaceae bacterium]
MRDLAARVARDVLGDAAPAARLTGADASGVAVSGVTLSSQRVRPGDLYAALPGARTHGATYAAGAVEAGAVAVLTDEAGLTQLDGAGAPGGVPVLVVPEPRRLLGRLAAELYDHPARRLTVIAVTGTQGKTTTTRLLDSALAAAGTPAAVIGTVGTRVRGQDLATSLTTPEAPDLHALFAAMVQTRVEVCAMEVSSHALVLGRTDGLVADVAAFTNLGRDHLDFHDTVEDYFAAKASLFTPARSRRGVVNSDDEFGRRLLAEASVPCVRFALDDPEAEWRAVDVQLGRAGSTFTVLGPGGVRVETAVGLPGRFNVANALCAIAVAGEAGLDVARIAEHLGEAGVPGRLEEVPAGRDLGVLGVVDYAHKPDAVTAAIEALRTVTVGRVITVIGAGGDRDRGKRPVMGRIAASLSDVVVVTDDNPRSEDPATIRAEVLAGTREAEGAEDRAVEVVEVGDRAEAIAYAVSLAAAGDTVLVAGKGHETGQLVDGTTHPFDDRDVLARAFRAAATDRGAS